MNSHNISDENVGSIAAEIEYNLLRQERKYEGTRIEVDDRAMGITIPRYIAKEWANVLRSLQVQMSKKPEKNPEVVRRNVVFLVEISLPDDSHTMVHALSTTLREYVVALNNGVIGRADMEQFYASYGVVKTLHGVGLAL